VGERTRSRAGWWWPGWLTVPILSVTVLSVASGIAQFGVTTVIGDVAVAYGEVVGDGALDQLGLPATTIGLALAVIRLASLGSLPTAALADRLGRRRVLLAAAGGGLALASLSALAWSFWAFVAIVALSRPLLSAINALAGVIAAEETDSRSRAWSLALIAAAYGLGAGIIAVGRGLLPGEPSFRVVMGLSLIPLLLLPLLARRIREPAIAVRQVATTGLPGRVPRALVPRVTLLAALVGAIALATGPGFTYLFVYGEGVLGASPLLLSTLVLGAGPAGLVGILIGRWAADRFGRTGTAGVSMALTGLAVTYAYAGTSRDLAIGYLLAITASSAFAPPTGAMIAELVPTSVRATVAGWETVAGVLGAVIGLTSFGVLADLTGGFAAAARWIGVGTAVIALGFRFLPETRGWELDQEQPPTRD
jgi:MFS family permease